MLYDTDKTGLESSAKYVQQLAGLGVKGLVWPLPGTKQEKDISDYFKQGNTREHFKQLFIEFLDNLYSETMAILKPCEIDFANPPVKSEMLISMNDVPLGTQGNLLGITGGEGTGFGLPDKAALFVYTRNHNLHIYSLCVAFLKNIFVQPNIRRTPKSHKQSHFANS